MKEVSKIRNSLLKQNKQCDVKKTEFLETLEDVAVNPEDGCKVLRVCNVELVHSFSKKFNSYITFILFLCVCVRACVCACVHVLCIIYFNIFNNLCVGELLKV